MKCDRCALPIPSDKSESNFTEFYDPKADVHFTTYLCDECQTRLCARVKEWVGGKYGN